MGGGGKYRGWGRKWGVGGVEGGEAGTCACETHEGGRLPTILSNQAEIL